MKKILSLLVFVAICCFISACSDEDLLISESEVNSQDLLSTKYDASLIKSCELDSIIPLEGDSVMMQKLQVKTRSTSSYSDLYEELHQLDQIPIYLPLPKNQR